uniref:Uncharacterized protein n=2 Tax=Phaeomonas parva TaxID=124430 RepID=A0A7S1UEX3_9STRA|mmetsp:Transcript_45165/g.141522  ORF Transcript_45165/g.141522 Transcript_45165/m.141522 type:complete len:350 (+) Transcript_45165:208-1257(+)
MLHDPGAYRAGLRRRLRLQESSLLSCCWSPAGLHVAAGSDFGRICVWDAQPLLFPPNPADDDAMDATETATPTTKRPVPPQGAFDATASPIYGLSSAPNSQLCVVAEEEVRLFRWADVLAPASAPEPVVTIKAMFVAAQKSKRPVMRPEFTCASAGGDGGVVVGCGDGCLRLFDVGKGGGALASVNEGHKRAIHSVVQVGSDPRLFVTASEDGTAGIWDLRDSAAVVRRAKLGSRSGAWAAAAAVDADGGWALVGGGRGHGVGAGTGRTGYKRGATLKGGTLSGLLSVVHLGSGRTLTTAARPGPVYAAAAVPQGWMVGGEGCVDVLPPAISDATAADGNTNPKTYHQC